MKAGDTVRCSGYVTGPLRDRWLACGRYEEKGRAKEHLDKAIAARGRVVSVVPGRFAPVVVTVEWNDGTETSGLPYLLEVVNEPQPATA